MIAIHVAGEVDDELVGDRRNGHGLVAEHHGLVVRDDDRQRGGQARNEAELDRLVIVEHRIRRGGVEDGRRGDATLRERLADADVEREIEVQLRERARLEGCEGGGEREECEEEHGGLRKVAAVLYGIFGFISSSRVRNRHLSWPFLPLAAAREFQRCRQQNRREVFQIQIEAHQIRASPILRV